MWSREGAEEFIWDTKLRHWINDFRRFEGVSFLRNVVKRVRSYTSYTTKTNF